MTEITLSGANEVDLFIGENTAEAIRQARIAADSAVAAALSAVAAEGSATLLNFRATLAEGVADFAVGDYFTSNETGELRMYERIVGAPYYLDQGDSAAPVTRLLIEGATGAALVGTAAGITVAAWIDARRRDVREWVTLDGVTNDAVGWQAAADDGAPLFMPEGTSIVGTGAVSSAADILISDGFDLEGVSPELCRIERRNFADGHSALFRPTTITTGVEGARFAHLQMGCRSGFYDSGGTVSGKIINLGASSDCLIDDVIVDEWNGWAISTAGFGSKFRDIEFRTPYAATGVDGLHFYGSTDASKPHRFWNVGGNTSDDMIGIFPIASGDLSDVDILGVIGHGVWGTSNLGRIVAIGQHTSAITNTIAHVHIDQIMGKGLIAANGAITIYQHPDTVGTVMRDIRLTGAVLDATGCRNFLYIAGPDADSPTQMTDIHVEFATMSGKTGPTGVNTEGVRLFGHLNQLTIKADMGDTAFGYEEALVWTEPWNSKGWDISGRFQCGTLDGITFPNSAANAVGYVGKGTLHDTRILNLATDKRGIEVVYTLNSTFRDNAVVEASGATTTRGFYEGADCSGNIIEGNDLSGVDTPVELAQADSTYRNNAGVTVRRMFPIRAKDMVTRTTNGAAAGSTESATNKVMLSTLDFDQTTDEFAQYIMQMPTGWDEGTITAQFRWSCGVTGTVTWGVQAVAISNDDLIDSAFGTAVTVTDTVTATTDVMLTAETSAMTIAGTPAAGDSVVFQIFRDPDTDNAAGDAKLIGVDLFLTFGGTGDQ